LIRSRRRQALLLKPAPWPSVRKSFDPCPPWFSAGRTPVEASSDPSLDQTKPHGQ